ncbi:arid bright domain protein [Diplodia corticola]|uniref:Arid bright domain protein n=1 Tax=Diplodia corticola TaxID=236234 RepID=A0A1J9RBV7_9PEZI|nr:arid bright domain protein [Diplodia corticola]OJD37945.1 arid bright domain protein [Diplodia corticola]
MNFDALQANNGYLDSQNSLIDPSMFSNNNIDLNAFQNPQLQQQRLQNGNVRNASPAAFQNPAYNVNPIVPSKRPRPSEDASSASPRPAPGNMSLSRSQTPQQMTFAPGAFQGNQQGLQAPNPYQHLQHQGSSNATPSPTMQSQQFRPPQQAHRMNTMSPNPFPQGQNMGMSPAPDQNSRVNTPQNPAMTQMAAMNMNSMNSMNNMNMMQGSPTGQGFNQNFGMNPGMSAAGFNGAMPVQGVALSQNLQQRQADAQRLYQMRLQQQQQQIAANNLAQRQQQAGGMNMLGSSGQQMNSAMAMAGGMRPNQGGMAMNNPPKQQEAAFLNNVQALMQAQGMPFNPQPMVCMRPVNLMQLYATVMKHRGSRNVSNSNGWSQLAHIMGFPPQQFPTAGQEIRMVYEQNLGAYEQAWLAKQRNKQGQQGQMPGMGGAPQASPVKSMPGGAQDLGAQQQQYLQRLRSTQMQAQQQQQQPMDQGTPMRNNSMPQANGWATPQPDPNAASQQEQHRKSMSRLLEATPQAQPAGSIITPSPGPGEKPLESVPKRASTEASAVNGTATPAETKVVLSSDYKPKVRSLLDTHGGILVDGHGSVGEKLAKLKPDVPGVEEMGVIDMRAISLSLQSGISPEVRFALDMLVQLSHDPRLHLELEKCEDLMDAIIDCAEDQVDALAEDSAEVSDNLDLMSYEDAMRNSRMELESLQESPECGSQAYELDRSADRLIAITTILRNLSFFESNHALLSSPTVIKFLSNTIRLLGTRIMLLRNNINTVDFMKDIVTFLSNTSDKIELPSRDDAYNILCFILAFAPSPAPNNGETIRFAPYNPAIHRYLPPAVDFLAKLLARDDPNRAFYRQLFLADAASTPPYDLLTRSFGLAISVVPERGRGAESRIAEARKPYLTQGMLAADILAGLCPGPESGVARSWLEAEDGWAKTLVWLSGILAMERQPPPPPPPGRGMPRPPLDQLDVGFGLITHRALAMLRKLGEKAQSEDEAREKRLSVDSLPKDEVLLGALCMQSMDGVALKKLCSFAELKG